MAIPESALAALRRHGPQTHIAVLGASNDPAKYGNIIVKNLLRHGYTVLPVHPSEPTIAGLPAHARVADIGGRLDIVNVVVPPKVTLRLIDELDAPQFDTLWLQPGSFDDAVVAAANAKFSRVVVGDCIMVVANWP